MQSFISIFLFYAFLTHCEALERRKKMKTYFLHKITKKSNMSKMQERRVVRIFCPYWIFVILILVKSLPVTSAIIAP